MVHPQTFFMGKSFSRPTSTLQRPISRVSTAPTCSSPDLFLRPDSRNVLYGAPSSLETFSSVSKSHHTSRSLRDSFIFVTRRLRRRSHSSKNVGSLPPGGLPPEKFTGPPRPCRQSSSSYHHSLCTVHNLTRDSSVPHEQTTDHTVAMAASANSLDIGSRSRVESGDIMQEAPRRHLITAPRSYTLSSSSGHLWSSPALPSGKSASSATTTLISPSQSRPPFSSSILPQVRPPMDSVSSSLSDTINCSAFPKHSSLRPSVPPVCSESATIGINRDQPSPSTSAFGGVERVSFVRPHERCSPYERCFNSSPHSPVKQLAHVKFNAQACTSSSDPDVNVCKHDLTLVPTARPNYPSSPLQLIPDVSSSVQPLTLTSVNANNAFNDVPLSVVSMESPILHAHHSRLSSTASTMSLTSEDLMLGTDTSSVYSRSEKDLVSPENNSKARNFCSSFRDHGVITRLESVTEVSLDNLVDNKVPDRETAKTSHYFHSMLCDLHDGLRSVRCLCQGSINCKCHTSSNYITATPDPLQKTNATSGSLSPRSLLSRRRLRSLPGRARAGSLSLSSYATFLLNEGEPYSARKATLGERTAVLCATDQRHILQDIQGVKLLLLKLRRLLTEDQWHLPVFAKQFSMTELVPQSRIRLPLPAEWLDLRSVKSSHDSTNPQLSDPNPLDSGHISDETFSPRHCGFTHEPSPTDAKNATPPSPDSSMIGLDTAFQLAEDLSLLQVENDRLGSTTCWTEPQ